MRNATVKFTNVGRGKHTWEAQVKAKPEDGAGFLIAVASHVSLKKLHGMKVLGSRFVDINTDDEAGMRGGLYVGGFRRVGEWAVVSEGSGNG